MHKKYQYGKWQKKQEEVQVNKFFKKQGLKSYFCKPYHSWGKGTVENINGLIRRFFHKGTDFDKITDRKIKKMQIWINSRPMKVLGFETPSEAYLQEIVPLAC